MNSFIEIIRKENQKTSQWSGGTTTQLAIYPKDVLYSERNFKWRLSSAIVAIEESVFTPLPGIWRHIMILDGEMTLEHEHHHSISLRPFEQDSFSGDWTTRSFGKAKDFNLMLAEGCKGALEHIYLKDRSVKTLIPADNPWNLEAIYCAIGSVSVDLEEHPPLMLYEGDLLLLHLEMLKKNISSTFYSLSNTPTHLVKVNIRYE